MMIKKKAEFGLKTLKKKGADKAHVIISGGTPNHKGDFSTVAKNSYYIENGKIQYPVNETMITGNIADVFMNILAVSKERINFGSGIFPWVLAGGITVSGK
ncbi:MAG: hypothetical protein JXJ04_00125 [Spirochaetales bacterium]|nr:hypothetical protein [Spirochaetales bacterium]